LPGDAALPSCASALPSFSPHRFFVDPAGEEPVEVFGIGELLIDEIRRVGERDDVFFEVAFVRQHPMISAPRKTMSVPLRIGA